MTTTENTIEIALKLEPGGIYIIEYPGMLSQSAMQSLRAQLDREQEKLGVKFLVLSDGMKIAKCPQQ